MDNQGLSTKPKNHLLRTGHLNICYLKNKIPDLCVYLDRPEPFHLFGITESHLDRTVSDEHIKIPNYFTVRRDACAEKETGIVVYIHNNISHLVRRRIDLESCGVECIWFEVKYLKSKPIYIAFIYRHPDSTFDWYDNFLNTVDKAGIHENDVLLLGDFNLDLFKTHSAWDCTITSVGLEQLVDQATRTNHRSSTLIDHIYSNRPQTVTGVKVEDLSISDHSPIVCSWVFKSPIKIKCGHTSISYRSFKRFDSTSFLADLHNTPFHCVYNETDPNQALELWLSLFIPILNKHAPIRRKRVKNKSQPQWLTQEIIEAMSLRDELKKQKRFVDYKKQRNRVKGLIVKAKKSLFDRMINDGNDISAMWRALNTCTRGHQKTSPPLPPNLNADSFNNHFLSIPKLLLPANSDSTTYTTPDTLIDFCKERTAGTQPFSIPFLSVHEVGKSIAKMASKKSSGPDEICPKILKMSLPYIVDSLTFVYNLCIQHNTFPAVLKDAKVIPLPKSKTADNISNFRPISLLSVLSKPLEKHVQKTLLQYVNERNLLYDLQSGFRPKHSCHTALTRLVDTWLISINEAGAPITGAVFLDFSKAFDLVDHNILLEKLKLYLRNDKTIAFFKSYLSHRTQRVYLQGTYSSRGIITHGVPQGSILGPILFCLFINDLPLQIRDKGVMCEMFADDATIHTPDTNVNVISTRLQQGLHDISQWCTTNSMVLNPSKTECMAIATRQKHQNGPLSLNLSINGNAVTQVDDHRLLGLNVDCKLEWKTHVENVCKKVSQNLFMLAKLKPLTDPATRKIFFNAHVKSHLDYVSTVWDGSSENVLKGLNSLYRRGAKLILTNPDISTDNKLKELDLLPLNNHFLFNKGVFMYKLLRQPGPSYLKSLFTANTVKRCRVSRALSAPYPRLDIFKTSLSYSGAQLWNSLPPPVRDVGSLSSFKTRLYKHLRTAVT